MVGEFRSSNRDLCDNIDGGVECVTGRIIATTFERVLLPQLRKRLLQYIRDEQFGFEPNTGTTDVRVVNADEIATAPGTREELRVVKPT